MSVPFFAKGNIEITQTMARFGNTTYPIASIGAVSVEELPHRLRSIAILATLGGAVGSMGSPENRILLLAILAGGLMLWFYCSRNQGAGLMLRTSSGNQQAFSSEDKVLVGELKNAIESAIQSRG